jgi:ribosome maturation factor RimP
LTVAEKIEKLILNELTDTDYFLVDKKISQNGSSMKFFVDGVNGVGIKTCSMLSRKVSAMLDEEEPEHTLRFEISSPGADNPLIDRRQYHQHIGRTLEVLLLDDSAEKGELKSVSDEALQLKVKVVKKKTDVKEIPFENIKESTVKISFKKVKK